MDPYGATTDFGYSGAGIDGSSGGLGSSKWMMYAGGAAVVVILVLAYIYSKGTTRENTRSFASSDSKTTTESVAPKVANVPSDAMLSLEVSEPAIRQEDPDIKLADFAFESYEKALFVPGAKGTLVRKPSGHAPYKLVACSDTSYAIRWMGRYLTVRDSSTIIWTEEKEEPKSCWFLVPGYCNNKNYVMLRSKSNRMFLRSDGPSDVLVCKDIPTARNATKFCWKLNNPVAGKQPCGAQYSYDLGRVINVPCNVRTTAKQCQTATPGFRASCCLGKKPGQDPWCSTITFPEVVGKQLNEAVVYIRTRRPDLVLRPCPEPCLATAYPTPSPNTVVIPYDNKTQFVTSPARTLV